ncbi:NAD(P)/FAD-dependent oxidoreductase [soil metagenome]
MSKQPLVAVIGAGFGGLKLVQGLRKAPVRVLIIDRHNYHLFQPLLYQVATAALSPADIAYPIRRIFRTQKNVQVVLGEVTKADLNGKVVGSDRASIKFDYIVFACGSTHSYFGHEEWKDVAPGLKTIDDATTIRRRMLLAFEAAEYEADDEARSAKLTFIVVGGGPTGVEMAGALREIAAKDIPRDFRSIDTTMTRIILVQGGDRLLPAFPPELSDRAKHDLESMGVQVRLNARVTNVDSDGIWIGDERLLAANVLWAAGVKAPEVMKSLGVPTDRSGRVIVNSDLSIPNYPNAFVIGDAAAVKDTKTGEPVPGLAPAAMQMGTFVAKIIAAEAGNASPPPRSEFHYIDKGTMATIGTRRAVADIKGFKFGGLFAWMLWSLIHLTFLVSFRNKMWVLLSWIYQYATNGREARLITGEVKLNVKTIRSQDDSSPSMDDSLDVSRQP